MSEYSGEEWDEFVRHAVEELLPKMRDSAVCIALASNDADVKMALEVGFMVLLNKPIIAVVRPGVTLSPKLAMIADEIVTGGLDDPDMKTRLLAAIGRLNG